MDSAARYSPVDWAQKQQAEPMCHAAMRYIVLGRPPVLPANIFSCFLSTGALFLDIQELAGKGYLHSTNDSIVLLVHQLTSLLPSDLERPVGRAACLLNDELARILRRAAHAPLGDTGLPFDGFLPPQHRAYSANARTFCWWISMNICTRYLLHN